MMIMTPMITGINLTDVSAEGQQYYHQSTLPKLHGVDCEAVQVPCAPYTVITQYASSLGHPLNPPILAPLVCL